MDALRGSIAIKHTGMWMPSQQTHANWCWFGDPYIEMQAVSCLHIHVACCKGSCHYARHCGKSRLSMQSCLAIPHRQDAATAHAMHDCPGVESTSAHRPSKVHFFYLKAHHWHNGVPAQVQTKAQAQCNG